MLGGDGTSKFFGATSGAEWVRLQIASSYLNSQLKLDSTFGRRYGRAGLCLCPRLRHKCAHHPDPGYSRNNWPKSWTTHVTVESIRERRQPRYHQSEFPSLGGPEHARYTCAEEDAHTGASTPGASRLVDQSILRQGRLGVSFSLL